MKQYALFSLFLLISCTSILSPPQRRLISLEEDKLGIHLLLDDGRSQWPTSLWRNHLETAVNIIGSGGTVTQLIQLDDLDPDKWQLFMDLCAEFDLIPIIRLATVYDRQAGLWEVPPVDGCNGRYTTTAAHYATFLTALTWPTDQHIIIVGNEPNHGDEWGSRPDPAAYAQFLIDVSLAVKTADPQACILNAPLDQFSPHTGSQPFANSLWYIDATAFLQEMHTAQPTVFDYIDGWGSHPYPSAPSLRLPGNKLSKSTASTTHRPPRLCQVELRKKPRRSPPNPIVASTATIENYGNLPNGTSPTCPCLSLKQAGGTAKMATPV